MEKVLHPDCSCGQPVAYEIELVPIYNDGFQVAAQQGLVHFHNKCENCLYEAYTLYEEYKAERDELPF